MSRLRALSVSFDRSRAVSGLYFGYGFYAFDTPAEASGALRP